LSIELNGYDLLLGQSVLPNPRSCVLNRGAHASPRNFYSGVISLSKRVIGTSRTTISNTMISLDR